MELNDASFHIAPLDSMRAGLLHGIGAFCDARIISIAGQSPWKGTSRGTPITLVSFGYAPTGPISTLTKSRGRVTLNEEGDELTGRFKTEVFDLQGNLVNSFNLSVHGKRVGVEALPEDLG